MKALGFGFVAASIFVVACGSSSPSDDCNHAMASICQKLFQCAATAAASQYGTESNCEVQFRAQSNCANLTCAVGTTYHSDKVQTCINDVNALQCSNPQTPASCSITSTDVCY